MTKEEVKSLFKAVWTMDYTSTDGFVNLVPIEHPNRQVHPQKKKKKSDLDDEQTSRKIQTVKIGSKSSLRL